MKDQLETFIKNQDADGLKIMFNGDETFRNYVLDNFWDATSMLSDYINDEHFESNVELVNACNYVLCKIAASAKPKEYLIVLLEQLDTFNDDTKFLVLIDPLCICLRNHDPLKSRWVLEASFDVLLAHLVSIPLPKSDDLEGEELLLLWNDPLTQRHLTLVTALIGFVKEYISGKEKNDIPFECRKVILTNLLRLYQHPLIELDFLSERSEGEDDSRMTAMSLYALFLQLVGCIHNYCVKALAFNARLKAKPTDAIFKSSGDDEEEEVQDKDESEVEADVRKRTYSELGLMCIFYITLVEGKHQGHYPEVFSPSYNLRLVISVIESHLAKSNVSFHVLRCALKLLNNSFKMIDSDFFADDIWDIENYKTILHNLTNIMTLGKVKDIRRLALNCFDSFLRVSDPFGKHRMLVIVLNCTQHNGIRSHIIKVIKDMVDLTLRGIIHSDVFVGKSLARLFPNILHLSSGVTSDLVQSADWIISSLNFVLYLVLADTTDKSSLWSHLDKIEKDFLNPIRTGLELSAVHYKQEKVNITKGEETTLEVGGMKLPPLSAKQKHDVMEKSLLTLDLINSIICRIDSAIDARKRNPI